MGKSHLLGEAIRENQYSSSSATISTAVGAGAHCITHHELSDYIHSEFVPCWKLSA